MTAMKYRSKPVWHQSGTADSQSGRPILAAESPSYLLVRLKGTRQVLRLPWSLVYLRAAVAEVATQRLMKINKRRAIKRGHVIGHRATA
jgi:hypothetical protein